MGILIVPDDVLLEVFQYLTVRDAMSLLSVRMIAVTQVWDK